MIMKIYRAILWFLGFSKGEYITYMLRRQEARLGVWWWLLVFGTQAAGTIIINALMTWPWSVLGSLPLVGLVGVLVWHVDNAKIPDEDMIEAIYTREKDLHR